MKEYVSGTFTDNASSGSVLLSANGLAFVGGAGGTDFGGGTVVVQAKGPDDQWYSVSDPFTTSDVRSLSFSIPVEVRLTMIGSTAPDCDYAIQSDNESYRD
jgi:hypothetical protein